MDYIISIDQGTTSSRILLFNDSLEIIDSVQKEFPQIYPESGWVEHDPDVIWNDIVSLMKTLLKQNDIEACDIASIGITNQRETTVIWDKKTGRPIYNAIVWQDRRTASYCHSLKQKGHEDSVREKTGLCLDPYFSASKINWLLSNIEGARERAENGDLLFGTIDSFLLWRLTGGQSHKTDMTNASRTLLMNIETEQWDEDLLSLFDIPASLLPEICENASEFGVCDPHLFSYSIPINALIGDQQSALVGQACFHPGMVKSTYGTGCFVLLNTGKDFIHSKNKILTTIAYKINGMKHYALEGSIFNAGTTIQWLRDNLKFFHSADETESLTHKSNPDTPAPLFVPAFTGLGAPYWDANARGAIFGIERSTSIPDIIRSALESVGYQTKDLLSAMEKDYEQSIATLRVDGGMVANNWAMQFLSDILGITVERAMVQETTALGAAYLAGYYVGLCSKPSDYLHQWQKDSVFQPQMTDDIRKKKYEIWQNAINSVSDFAKAS